MATPNLKLAAKNGELVGQNPANPIYDLPAGSFSTATSGGYFITDPTVYTGATFGTLYASGGTIGIGGTGFVANPIGGIISNVLTGAGTSTFQPNTTGTNYGAT